MRHRIANDVNSCTGLGNPSPALMDGKSTGDPKRDKLINECAKEAYKTFFKGTAMDFDYCDAQEKLGEVRIGVEPAYMYQRLKMLSIQENKKASYIATGYAWGAWGSGLRQTRRYYVEYKTSTKFTRFVDKWHSKLFPGVCE